MNKLNLKTDQKVSILLPNDLVPTLYKGVIKGYYFSKYAQYENALYIYLQRPRAKKVDRIVITESNTVFIFDGYGIKNAHRKEIISQTENTTLSKLHRLTYDNVKDWKNLIYYHEFRKPFENINDNFEYFADVTTSYIIENGIKPIESIENEGYINYIKELIKSFNVSKLLEYARVNEYRVLEKCLKAAISYNW